MAAVRCWFPLCFALAALLSTLSATAMAQRNHSAGCLPPSIIQQGRTIVYYVQGDVIGIRCLATGDGPLTYQWTKNGNVLSVSGERMALEPGVGTLVISSIQHQDVGYYQCQVSNACGVSLSVKTRLICSSTEPFPVQTTPRRVRAFKGMSTRLTCNQPPSIPPARISWYLVSQYDGYGVDEDGYGRYTPIEPNERVTLDYDGNLYILSVQAQDEHGGRAYACLASNPIVRVHNIGGDTTLTVLGRDGPGLTRPLEVMWHSPRNLIALEGESAEMKCIIAGNPLPTTRWTLENAQLNNASRVGVYPHELTIYNVQPSDAGTYRCTGETDLQMVSVEFTLTVQSRPRWVVQPTDTTATPGETAVFGCRAAGNPEPTVQWFINGQPLQDVPSEPRISVVGNTLRLSALTLNDSRVVQCNASNAHGYLWADAYLHVHAPASNQTRVKRHVLPSFLDRPITVTVDRGQTAHLVCAIQNLGPRNVVWRKMNEVSPIAIGRIVFAQDSRYSAIRGPGPLEWTLTIAEVRPSDVGTYECEVSSSRRSLRYRIRLRLNAENRPTFLPSPNHYAATEHGTVRLPCAVQNLGTRTVYWRRTSEPNVISVGTMIFVRDDRYQVETSPDGTQWTLVISDVRLSDAGQYTCQISARESLAHNVLLMVTQG